MQYSVTICYFWLLKCNSVTMVLLALITLQILTRRRKKIKLHKYNNEIQREIRHQLTTCQCWGPEVTDNGFMSKVSSGGRSRTNNLVPLLGNSYTGIVGPHGTFTFIEEKKNPSNLVVFCTYLTQFLTKWSIYL